MRFVLCFVCLLSILFVLSMHFKKTSHKLSLKTHEGVLPNHIWLYWENKPYATKPAYLDLCYETVKKHCGSSFHVHLLDEKSVFKYLPRMRTDLSTLRIPQKADYIRLSLLKKYGGVWLDADIIVFSDLYPFLEKLRDYDFVGFGCHSETCRISPTGFPRPANWVMFSRKNGRLISNCLRTADRIIDTKRKLMHKSKFYHVLGRKLLWGEIDALLATRTWTYYHEASTCLDRDSKNVKWTNKRILSKEKMDTKCNRQLRFVPVYNTAPGFEQWFLDLSKEKILAGDYLISEMFRKSLEIQIESDE